MKLILKNNLPSKDAELNGARRAWGGEEAAMRAVAIEVQGVRV